MSKKEEWVKIGIVGVDSGRLIITDYPDEPEVKDAWSRMEDAGWPQYLQLNYAKGHAGAGVVVTAGIGDGVYPVYARWEDVEGFGRRVAEVKVVFLPHPVLG